MKRVMACAVGVAVAALPMLASDQAAAQSQLPKTCRGTFTVEDGAPGRRLGAFQIMLAGTTERPTAHLWRGFGDALLQKVSDEVNRQVLSTDLAGFEDLGPAQDVQFQGGQISLRTRQGVGITLELADSMTPRIFDGSAFINSPTPGEPAGRYNWRGAEVHMLCR